MSLSFRQLSGKEPELTYRYYINLTQLALGIGCEYELRRLSDLAKSWCG